MPRKKKTPIINKIIGFVAVVLVVSFVLALPQVASKIMPNDPGKFMMYNEYIYTGSMVLLLLLLTVMFAGTPLFLVLFGLVTATMVYHFLRKIKVIKK